jgi:hypothetical protein
MQAELHSIWPATLQLQLPPLQEAPAWQAMLQPPQLRTSVPFVTTHAVPHWVWPLGQLVPQVLPLQSWPLAQAWPQLPQLLESEGTQALLQLSVPEPHVHVPLLQD